MVRRLQWRGVAKWAAARAKAGRTTADENEDLGSPPSPRDSSYYQDQVDDFHEARSLAALTKGWSEVESGDEDGNEEEEVLALDIDDENDKDGERTRDEEDSDDDDDGSGSSVQSENEDSGGSQFVVGSEEKNFTMTQIMVPNPEVGRVNK